MVLFRTFHNIFMSLMFRLMAFLLVFMFPYNDGAKVVVKHGQVVIWNIEWVRDYLRNQLGKNGTKMDSEIGQEDVEIVVYGTLILGNHQVLGKREDFRFSSPCRDWGCDEFDVANITIEEHGKFLQQSGSIHVKSGIEVKGYFIMESGTIYAEYLWIQNGGLIWMKGIADIPMSNLFIYAQFIIQGEWKQNMNVHVNLGPETIIDFRGKLNWLGGFITGGEIFNRGLIHLRQKGVLAGRNFFNEGRILLESACMLMNYDFIQRGPYASVEMVNSQMILSGHDPEFHLNGGQFKFYPGNVNTIVVMSQARIFQNIPLFGNARIIMADEAKYMQYNDISIDHSILVLPGTRYRWIAGNLITQKSVLHIHDGGVMLISGCGPKYLGFHVLNDGRMEIFPCADVTIATQTINSNSGRLFLHPSSLTHGNGLLENHGRIEISEANSLSITNFINNGEMKVKANFESFTLTK